MVNCHFCGKNVPLLTSVHHEGKWFCCRTHVADNENLKELSHIRQNAPLDYSEEIDEYLLELRR